MKMPCCCVDSKTMPHQPDVVVKVKEHFLSQDTIHHILAPAQLLSVFFLCRRIKRTEEIHIECHVMARTVLQASLKNCLNSCTFFEVGGQEPTGKCEFAVLQPFHIIRITFMH